MKDSNKSKINDSEIKPTVYQPIEISNINVESYIWLYYKELGHKIFAGNFNKDIVEFFLRNKSYELVASDASIIKDDKYLHLLLLDKKNKCIISLNSNNFTEKNYYCSIYATEEKKLKAVQERIEQYRILPKKVQKSYLMLSSGSSLYLQECPLPHTFVNIENNHNQDFAEVHTKIVDNLKHSKSGLYLFHGQPGTGKSSYIKYLTEIVDRRFIFVPSTMINSLTDCQIIKVLHDHKDSVLVLEDAERAVLKRDGSTGDSIVSAILNLSDGILGSILNTSLILSFNTLEDSIDPALLRKGRLLAKYKFDKLCENKAGKMLENLFPDKGYQAIGDMTLAEIYNFENDSYIVERKKVVGFSQ